MKRQVLSHVLTAGLLVIAAVSFANAGQFYTLTAKVPFDFTVGEVSLPAGDYTLYESTSGSITVQSTHRNECMYLTNPGTSAKDHGRVRFIFHRYGEQYFLSEVFNGTEGASRKLAVSKLEKDHIGAASYAVAENPQPRDVVIFGTR